MRYLTTPIAKNGQWRKSDFWSKVHGAKYLVGSPAGRINLNLFATPIKKGSTGRPAVIHGYYRDAQPYKLFVSLTRCIYRSRIPYKRRTHFASDFMFVAILSGSPLPRRSSLSLPHVIKQFAAERRFIICTWYG